MASPIPVSMRGKPVQFRDPTYFQELVSKWIPAREVWPFKYGDDALCGFASVSTAYAVYYIRHTLRMGRHARLATYSPTLAIAWTMTLVFQQQYVTRKIINMNSCPVCTQLVSSAGQVLIGGLLPFSSASVMSFYFADKLLLYPVPSLLQAPKELAQLWWKLIKKNRTVFLAHAAVQTIAASAITYQKQLYFLGLEREFT